MEAAALALHAEDVLLNRRLGANGAPLLRQIIKTKITEKNRFSIELKTRKTGFPLNSKQEKPVFH
jgi:hypothetical protein